MADLIVSFSGMALLGYSDKRAEALFLSTDLVQLGHKHLHKMVIGKDTTVDLHSGKLVTLEDDDERLKGELKMDGSLENFVDLDKVLPGSDLRPELKGKPEPGGDWKKLLSAWVRLPGGTIDAKADPAEVWSFPNGVGERALTENFAIVRKGVTNPAIRIQTADGENQRIEIPKEGGVFRVTFATIFNGPPSPLPKPGVPEKLTEVLLLYACVTPSAAGRLAEATEAAHAGNIPTRTFTEADVQKLPSSRFTHDITVCPPGAKKFQEP
jgi:hypothetical protein